MKRIAVALAIVPLLILTGTAAYALPTWSVVPSPNSQLPTGVLSGVSCAASNACTAVGFYPFTLNGYNDPATLAESWNGTTWSVVPTPNPAQSNSSSLSSVSCTTADACIAVGWYKDKFAVDATLAEVWNGNSWSILPMALPLPSPTGTSSFSSISCTASNACIAVGLYATSENVPTETLAESWNGTSWSVQSTPNPSGSTNSHFNAISCVAADACTADGTWQNSSGVNGTLLETWNGASWSLVSTPNPSDLYAAQFTGVSCTASDACTAVGYYENTSFVSETLAERWDGVSWTIQFTPNPTGSLGSFLSNVACAGANGCNAIGSYSTSTPSLTFAEHWNGTTWVVQSASVPTGSQDGVLYTLSCPTANLCVAVGDYQDPPGVTLTLAEAWNSSSWSVQSTPNPGEPLVNMLSGISCKSSTLCVAVGSYVSSGYNATLAEAWNGKRWSIQPMPEVDRPAGGQLVAVSCTAWNFCMAIGYGDSETVTLAEFWNGKRWLVRSVPSPVGEEGSQLNGVACTSWKFCTAVGYSWNVGSNVHVPLAEHWNGRKWSIQPTPNPTGSQNGYLYGVSCTAPNVCTAVGYYYRVSQPDVGLAERWNGTHWTIQTIPTSQLFGTVLTGVSCSASNACTSVGSFGTAEQWNGKSWSFQNTLKPKGVQEIELSTVSCTAWNACTAVGYARDPITAASSPLAEFWNGVRWSLNSTANPHGSTSSELSGISCTDPGGCTAVGSTDGTTTLIEHNAG